MSYNLNKKDRDTVNKHSLTAINHIVNGLGYLENGKEEPMESAIIAAYYELEQLITETVDTPENYTGDEQNV